MQRRRRAATSATCARSEKNEGTDRFVGSTITIDPTLWVGWRVAILRHAELTPALGVGERVAVDTRGRAATWARPTLALGFTVGWMF